MSFGSPSHLKLFTEPLHSKSNLVYCAPCSSPTLGICCFTVPGFTVEESAGDILPRHDGARSLSQPFQLELIGGVRRHHGRESWDSSPLRDSASLLLVFVFLRDYRERNFSGTRLPFALLVDLSLETPNKVTIVRSGFVPYPIDVLKSGC